MNSLVTDHCEEMSRTLGMISRLQLGFHKLCLTTKYICALLILGSLPLLHEGGIAPDPTYKFIDHVSFPQWLYNKGIPALAFKYFLFLTAPFAGSRHGDYLSQVRICVSVVLNYYVQASDRAFVT